VDDKQSESEDFQDPQQWRARVEEMRQNASDMASPELKERMLATAVQYERLADFAERRRTAERPKGSGSL
jgi:hypothetical protein